MTEIGILCLVFAGIALGSAAALFIITRDESVYWGWLTSWWYFRRKRAKEKRPEQRVVLPKAYLVAPDAGSVVRLADAVGRRVK